ncbi:MAG: hypothetical protein MRY72_13355 [Aquisalinus sp.]|nr:hypothetical protein [Aquisalinus sp.]
MKKVIVHIGYPKCGSSAIQHFLCHNQQLYGDDVSYRYFVMGKEGIMSQQEVTALSRRSLSGYVASVGSLSNALLSLQDHLATQEDDDFIPIISQEGWGSNDDIADLRDVSDQLRDEVELHIVGYVRPQISWLQSAWWQWYAWRGDGLSLDKAWKWLKHTVKWHGRLQRFAAIPSVGSVTARLQDAHADVTRDLLDYLQLSDTAYQAGKRINTSVTANHVAIYRRLPFLRPPHDSRADLIIEKLFPTRKRPPFIITREFAADVLAEVYEDNIALLDSLGDKAKATMQRDQRWWSVEAYAEYWLKEHS